MAETGEVDLSVMGFDPTEMEAMLKEMEDRGGFLEDEAASLEGGDSESVGVKGVNVAFTMSLEDRAVVMRVLADEARRCGLSTRANALIEICKEKDEG